MKQLLDKKFDEKIVSIDNDYHNNLCLPEEVSLPTSGSSNEEKPHRFISATVEVVENTNNYK